TISIDKQSRKGELGIGSGVVWDSDPDQEYNETILKGNFLTNPLKYFELIETILVENGELFLLKYHLNRLKQSSEYFQFNYDENKIVIYLKDILTVLEQNKNYRLKLLVDKWGYIKHEIAELYSLIEKTTAVISNHKINSKNRFQYFKTTNRELYDLEYSNYNSGNICDVIFLNERNEITEGSRTNIFIKKDNQYFTPPLESGILNGCYREYFLEKEINVTEMVLSIDDICEADELLLVNSVRKIQRINKLYLNGQLISEYS
ncbi:MAG: aminotransferase class IV, partial [Melioribacteraceae bacterium]|nr:aminotransferase class IV [Melioribacteraceae bacterium]